MALTSLGRPAVWMSLGAASLSISAVLIALAGVSSATAALCDA